MKLTTAAMTLMLAMTPAWADETAATAEEPGMTAEEFVASLTPHQGDITLPGDFAHISLPQNFIYLDSDDTNRLLTMGWGNPDGSGTLGMILPQGTDPLSAEGWGIILTYDADGYVADTDAADINYTDLLADMQESTRDGNQERIDAGYDGVELVGWALPPSYDRLAHKMVWAKELRFGNMEENTLNYNIRVLGREGVLVMNAVASMSQLDTIRNEAPSLVAATEFLPGKRYADFNADTDHVAEYGLAALVAGGVGAKLGLFGKLAALLIAFKKFIIMGVIALGALFMKLFGRKKG